MDWQRSDPLMDDSLLRAPEPSMFPTAAAGSVENLFQYEQYDWRGFKVEGQAVLMLTQGYFTFIGEEDVERLRGKRACVVVENSRWTGWQAKVRAYIWDASIGRSVLLHRYLMDAKPGRLIDHNNNWKLDNRRIKNLYSTSSSANNANRFNERRTNKGLKRGVEPCGGKFKGQIKHDGVTYRSELLDTEEEAHAWYVAKYEGFYGKTGPTQRPARTYPIFPPLKERHYRERPLGESLASLVAPF